MSLSPGTRLGHYDVTALLGEGGMGQVWQATDTQLNRQVALKILPDAFAADPDRLARFKREAQVLASLNHPNIVTIYAVEQADDRRFIAMEFVGGQSLDQVMSAEGLPLNRLLALSVQLADAVSAAHEHGIVHRDLKPANVMVGDRDRIKVLDFGLARVHAASPTETGSEQTTAMATREGLVMGTVPYMSPEQLRGQTADQRSDIFSLGAVLYELATGRHPFPASSSAEQVSSILRDEPSTPSELGCDLPEHFCRTMLRCLEKEPQDRFSSASDLHYELRTVQRELTEKRATASEPTRLSRAPARARGRQPRPFEVRYARRVDGARTAYGVIGSGPVLILPPGNLTHLEWYTADTEAHQIFCVRLAEHRTLVLYDRHGFGLSDRNRTDFMFEDDEKDLEAVIEAVGASKLDFFGISWGGGPTLAYAAAHPERVRKIVLYGTGSVGRVRASEDYVAREKSLAALRRADWELYHKTRVIQFFPSGTDPETFASFGRMLRDSATPEMVEQLSKMHPETQSLLSGIAVPALVLHRRGDQVALFDFGQYLARELPNARFVPLDGDVHFPWCGDADSVLNPTIEFLTADDRSENAFTQSPPSTSTRSRL